MSQPPRAVVAPRVERGRLLGLDAARGAAIVAMVIAHGIPFLGPVSRKVAIVLTQVNDVVSPLFAIVMGATAAMAVQRGRRAGTAGMRSLVVHNLLRGVVLIALGVALEQLHTWVAIILHILGVLLIVATPLAFLGPRLQVGLAVLVSLVSPFVLSAVRAAAGRGPGALGAEEPPAWASNPLLDWLVLNGHYRVLSLLPLFLLGAAIHQWGPSRRTSLLTVVAGVAIMVPWAISVALGTGHGFSGDLLDQSHETGLALAAYGILTALDTEGERMAGWLRTVAQPVAALGTVALSLYVFHVGLLWVLMPRFATSGTDTSVGRAGWLLALLLPTVAVGWLWWRFLGKGPIERLVDLVVPRRQA